MRTTKAQRKFIAHNRAKLGDGEMARRLGLDAETVRRVIAEMNGQGVPGGKARAVRDAAPGKRTLLLSALPFLVVAAVSLLSYMNSFDAELIYDNRQIILNNPLVKDPEQAGRIWSTDYWGGVEGTDPNLYRTLKNLYRPLTIFTYYLNYRVLGNEDRPAGYHAVNLALHTINGFLVYLFVVALVRGGPPLRWRERLVGLFAALLFAAHPVQTEAVTNVVGRADLLAMAFTLAALLLHLKGSEPGRENRMPFFIAAAAAFLLGLLSKENAVAMIALALALDAMVTWPRVKEQTSPSPRFFAWFRAHALKSYSLYVVVTAGWLVVRTIIIGETYPSFSFPIDNPLETAPLLQREMTAVVVLGFYMWRLVFPLTLSADYSYNQIPLADSPLDWRFLASIGAVIALGAAVVFFRRRRAAAFFILFFFIAIAPVSNVLVITGTIAAERLLYMPSLAWCALAAMGVFGLSRIVFRGRALLAASCAVLAAITGLYVLRTLARNPDWHDMPSLWRAAYLSSPRSVKALHNYAVILYEKREYDEALRLLDECVSIAPGHVRTYGAFGSLMLDRGGALDAAAGTARPEDEGRLKAERDAAYRRAYELLDEGMRLAEVRQRRADEYFADRKPDIAFPASWWEMHLPMAKACRRMADIYDAEGSPDEARRALERGVKYCRAILSAQLTKGDNHAELAALLLAQARHAEGAERRAFEKEAAISAARALMVDPNCGAGWKALAECANRRDISAARLFITDETGKPRLNAEADEVKRAIRSLIMLNLALGRKNWPRHWAEVARGEYGMPEEEISSLFRRKYSMDDRGAWLGE